VGDLLERAGVSRSVAMKLTEHKTEAVFRRYAITSTADLAEGEVKLATLHGSEKPTRTVYHSRLEASTEQQRCRELAQFYHNFTA
jgi:hypothetical protein